MQVDDSPPSPAVRLAELERLARSLERPSDFQPDGRRGLFEACRDVFLAWNLPLQSEQEERLVTSLGKWLISAAQQGADGGPPGGGSSRGAGTSSSQPAAASSSQPPPHNNGGKGGGRKAAAVAAGQRRGPTTSTGGGPTPPKRGANNRLLVSVVLAVRRVLERESRVLDLHAEFLQLCLGASMPHAALPILEKIAAGAIGGGAWGLGNGRMDIFDSGPVL